MGKKRGKHGKHLFLHGACLFAFLFVSTGCTSTALHFTKERPEVKHLDHAQTLLHKADFEGALKEYDQVLRLSPSDSPGDFALFHMGIVWAHPDNPQRNYKKALQCFQRLIRKFPRSDFTMEAEVWTSVIYEFFQRERTIENLEEDLSVLKDRLNTLKEIDIGIEEKRRKDPPKR